MSGKQPSHRPPSVERLLQSKEMQPLIDAHGRGPVADAIRSSLDNLRPEWLSGASQVDVPSILASVTVALTEMALPSLRRAVNATGVILHTGLGRAVLAEAARERAIETMAGHSSLEIEIETGERGSRHDHVRGLLCGLTGAEDAIVVNNDAGAVLLALASLARGREVIVSRGELVEIGGGFRVPDVMEQSGATLVEVGTTNKTRAEDYERAITPNTAALLKVHPSNFRVTGFTEEASLSDLAGIANGAGVAMLDDLGSGALVDVRRLGLGDEPTVQERLKQGAHVVMFSGDKLLGGPQAGIIVGRADIVDGMRRHPLARALRCDKTTIAALEGTLRIYRAGRAWEQIPGLQALAMTADEVRAKAESLSARLRGFPGVTADVVASTNRPGAGTMPGQELASFAVAVDLGAMGPNGVAAALRKHEPPVFGHIAGDRFLLEPRTLLPGEDDIVVQAVREATVPAR